MSDSHDKVRKEVAKSYALAVEQPASSCCGSGSSCCGGSEPVQKAVTARLGGYQALELKEIPADAVVNSFGCGNPRPILCATGVRLAEPPKRIGASERHLSLKLVQHHTTMRGVGFGCADWADELAAADAPLDIAYKPVINDFRGRQTVEVQLVDWRMSQVAS